jgi:hypothetical protein
MGGGIVGGVAGGIIGGGIAGGVAGVTAGGAATTHSPMVGTITTLIILQGLIFVFQH